MRESRVWPLYVGGFLGPYGSTMVTPIVHEVSAGLSSTPQITAGAVTAYMLPFAALMLFSGTLAERWGRGRVLRAGTAGLVVATALCAAAPTIELFLTARALQGAANAFTTPLLMAAVSDLVTGPRLARSLSWFAAAQAAGQGMSPLFSGVSASVHWRLAFVVPGLCGLLLWCLPPSSSATRRASARPVSWRSLANRRLAVACAVSFLCYLASVGLTVMVVLRARERFALGPMEIGLLSSAFGLAGICAAPVTGRLLGRKDLRTFGMVSNVLLAAGLFTVVFASTLWALMAGVALVGSTVTGLRSVTNTLAVTSAPDNRGGAASLALSAQFFGGAAAAPLWLPMYHAYGDLGFAAAAIAPVTAIIVLRTALGKPEKKTTGISDRAGPHPRPDAIR
ncbi:MFS transporter [Streptomyces sp. DvalAA-19]|uniref:MFS transporter n=1 Tax=Streptomyces sp. DvalAA-19 TaxID=1839761 RepID=UPI00081B3E2C|nr:MFS transporter [Streptomyces sp. DvalAA-19]SCD61506.1 Predicted arabinose efflux permease, MFS family [Streptomyces sp. DvalAA-19]